MAQDPSFLFIVNELPTNDDPGTEGSVEPRQVHQRWLPPESARGFFAQEPGCVYRWDNGIVSRAYGYNWHNDPQSCHSGSIYAINPQTQNYVSPLYYRSATTFFCNRSDKFFTTRGHAGLKEIRYLGPEDGWTPLTFTHENGISYVGQGYEHQHTAVRRASWIDSLLPKSYRCEENGPASNEGGLSGLLEIIIALVAFSCSARDLNNVLLHDNAWRGHDWRPHGRQHGRKPRRGMVVIVYLDPENAGSTTEALYNFEGGPHPVFK
ncbi:hypothetical protein BJ878DRAFT_292198 [Calycina marina]|uniref:Uncharacterized protein n=1 Tax=Calycina marina TaxID=1763456 RepID=A0A9P7YW09_9HELO|nr:hypothetical protein BJ878DRAFT_292198 [Calycina marina]